MTTLTCTAVAVYTHTNTYTSLAHAHQGTMITVSQIVAVRYCRTCTYYLTVIFDRAPFFG